MIFSENVCVANAKHRELRYTFLPLSRQYDLNLDRCQDLNCLAFDEAVLDQIFLAWAGNHSRRPYMYLFCLNGR